MPIKTPPDYSKFLMSPMPGAIININATVGQKVIPNQELIIMEAMKMQNILRAKGYGVIKKINCVVGGVIPGNFKLIEFE